MRTLVTVVGARPQFIKAAPVSRALRAGGVREILVHTGQHYDENMSDVFFSELGLAPPDHHLGVGSGTHGAMTGRMLEAIEGRLLAERPDGVLVYGDTNSTLAGALAAVKLHIPVAHVEAGLRSFNRRMPEEINRIVTDHVSTLLFAPTETAVAHLRNEGVAESAIHLTGDVMYDAALHFGERAAQSSRVLDRLQLAPRAFILATIHRAENTDHRDRLRVIVAALVELARRTPVVLPVHPRTRAVLEREGLMESAASALRLLPPVGYLDMIMLERSAAVVVTDSGGVQKEAFFYETPCVTLRDQTEWVELVEAGWNRLCPPRAAPAVADAVHSAIGSRGRAVRPYGDGRAAQRIVELLRDPAMRETAAPA